MYVPQTKESKLIYEAILRIISERLGDKSDEVLADTANEVLALLKLDDIKQEDKRKELSAIFEVNDATFSRLLQLTKEIRDYSIGMRRPQTEGVQGQILNIAFEDDEVEGEELAKAVQEVDEESYDAEFDDAQAGSENDQEQGKGEDQEREELGMAVEIEQQTLDAEEIDKFWLPNQLEKYFSDPAELKRKEEQIMLTLNLDDEIECQNRLAEIFDHDHFEFIKLLHDNRHTIYYMTKLTRAGDEEKKRLLDDMRGDVNGSKVLEQVEHLEQAAGKTEDILSSNLMKDAKTLRKFVEENKKDKEKLKNIKENDEYARLTKTVLNLNNLEFTEGGHYMANDNCKLPKGSFKQAFNGYEEVYIPPKSLERKHLTLKKVAEMPEWSRPAFLKIKELNVIQSLVYECAFKSAENMLICAPTGAGKTNIALLSILQQIGTYMDTNGMIDRSKFKIVYIAPMKALVTEVVGAFTSRLSGRPNLL